jgi:hypothetical protein
MPIAWGAGDVMVWVAEPNGGVARSVRGASPAPSGVGSVIGRDTCLLSKEIFENIYILYRDVIGK